MSLLISFCWLCKAELRDPTSRCQSQVHRPPTRTEVSTMTYRSCMRYIKRYQMRWDGILANHTLASLSWVSRRLLSPSSLVTTRHNWWPRREETGTKQGLFGWYNSAHQAKKTKKLLHLLNIPHFLNPPGLSSLPPPLFWPCSAPPVASEWFAPIVPS